MARRPLPRILTDSAPLARMANSTSLARSRELARTAADGASDVFHPLIVIGRGLRRLGAAGRGRWLETPRESRGPMAFFVGACVLVMFLVPYGPLLALIAVMGAGAWAGRERTPVETGPGEAERERLTALYEALVPYFSAEGDTGLLYTHGGDWERAFTEYAFDESGRIERLQLKYPAYFTDGEDQARVRIEQVLYAKAGRGREYHFGWDELTNQLTLTALGALPADIGAQRFVTSPGETVLGFTDPDAVQRTLPVTAGEETRDAPPVVWRTGQRATEPHLLVLGQPGTGATTLLRSIAVQALQDGDVLIVDGGGTGEYGALAGRRGVLGVESGLAGALAALEWASHETERRLIAANRARQAGRPAPEDTRRPLWIIADRPTALAHVAVAEGREDPQQWLQVPLRHGRAALVTVVVADQFESAELLSDPVRAHTKARVVLGPATAEEVRAVLGAPPHTTPTAHVPPGRGYARLGSAPVLRLQVPATPDPLDDATGQPLREAVLALLPERTIPADDGGAGDETGTAHETVTADGAGAAEPVAGSEPEGPAGSADAGRPVNIRKSTPPDPAEAAEAETAEPTGAAEAPEPAGRPAPADTSSDAETPDSTAEPVGAGARVRTVKDGASRAVNGSPGTVRAEG
ncbi:ATP-binding protein [Streptomyces angustmyceticus]|uniref:ATP-binding protein n=1 Tax=Streptomyces angustmyceticus TaxID=285578 RepID=UPI0021AE90EA|nr:ATP-binding protein [Streptomyces angustmyceticus]